MRFYKALALLAIATFLPCPAPGQEKPTAPASLAELQAFLETHVTAARFKAGTFGVKVVSAKSGKVVFEHDADELLSPASNAKLYTVALALDRLGENYRIRTSLLSSADLKNSTLQGDLILYGRGDPCINGRLNRGNLSLALQPLVTALTNAGVRRIAGSIIADESHFAGHEFGSGWTWDDLENYYGAEVSALTIDDNVVVVNINPGEAPGQPCTITLKPETSTFSISNQSRTVAADGKRTLRLFRPVDGSVLYVIGDLPLGGTGSEDVPVNNPAAVFAEQFKRTLERNGVSVEGGSRVRTWLDKDCIRNKDITALRELASMESRPMRELASEILKPSQNLYTDLILAHIGEKSRSRSGGETGNSERLGIRELQAFLKKAGISESDVHFEEGSGLSRNNLTTANATIALLQYINQQTTADAYWASMPVAGVDGTLRNRMKDTPAAKNLRAKTGTLRWAYSLSGDVRTAAGERLLFSIMLNRYYNTDAQRTTRSELDEIALALAGFTGRVDE